MTSIEKRLTDALTPIGWKIYNAVATGKEDRYLIIRHSDHPALPGDDRPGALRVLVYVDVYCPLAFNPVATVNAVRRALYNAGMTYPTTEDASDDDSRHIVIECEAIGSPELEEPAPAQDAGTGNTAAAEPAETQDSGTASTAAGTEATVEVRSRWA